MANCAHPDQLKTPTYLNLHCLQRQDMSEFSRTRVKSCYSTFPSVFVPDILLFGAYNNHIVCSNNYLFFCLLMDASVCTFLCPAHSFVVYEGFFK